LKRKERKKNRETDPKEPDLRRRKENSNRLLVAILGVLQVITGKEGKKGSEPIHR
jgi:hypothetical protein